MIREEGKKWMEAKGSKRKRREGELVEGVEGSRKDT